MGKKLDYEGMQKSIIATQEKMKKERERYLYTFANAFFTDAMMAQLGKCNASDLRFLADKLAAHVKDYMPELKKRLDDREAEKEAKAAKKKAAKKAEQVSSAPLQSMEQHLQEPFGYNE